MEDKHYPLKENSIMKATELRIGNYVQYKNKIVKFAIEDFTEADNNNQFLDLFVKPIPLTIEWLEILGFKRDAEMNTYYLENDLFTFHLNQVLNKFYEDQYDVQLTYVHQLQNLYFALTGEELEK